MQKIENSNDFSSYHGPSIVHNVNYLKQFILFFLFSGSVKARVLL